MVQKEEIDQEKIEKMVEESLTRKELKDNYEEAPS
jgi:hypothetical protein